MGEVWGRVGRWMLEGLVHGVIRSRGGQEVGFFVCFAQEDRWRSGEVCERW